MKSESMPGSAPRPARVALLARIFAIISGRWVRACQFGFATGLLQKPRLSHPGRNKVRHSRAKA